MKYAVFLFLFSSCVAFCQQLKPDDALLVAASANDVGGIKRALANGANINSTTLDGQTPLIHAAFLGHLEAVHALIDEKADLNHRDSTGETALMYSVGPSPQIASQLIEAGADVNITDNNGRTALMHTTNPQIKKRIKDAGGKEIKWTNPWVSTPVPASTPSTSPIFPKVSPVSVASPASTPSAAAKYTSTIFTVVIFALLVTGGIFAWRRRS